MAELFPLGRFDRMAFNSTSSTLRDRAYQIARGTIFAMFAMVPIHFIFHRWQASDIITSLACALLLVVAVLVIVARRFGPLGWGILAVVLHGICGFA